MGNPWALTERQKVIDLWLRCAVNFYGVITPRAFLVLFNRHNTPKLLKDELMKYSHKLNRRIEKNYFIYTNYIVGTDFPKEKIDEILCYQDGKKFYYPDKEEFLKFESKDHYTVTTQTKAFIEYLRKKYSVNIFKGDALARKISYLSRTESGTQDILNVIADADLKIQDIDEFGLLMPYIADVINHTRKWANCGFTADELFNHQ